MKRRKVKIPDILYHVTNVENIDSILNYGLIPYKQLGACYNDELNDSNRYGVYLTSDYNALIEIDPDFKNDKNKAIF